MAHPIEGLETRPLTGRTCPYRGFPNVVELDERCPTSVEVVMLRADDAGTPVGHGVPVLRQDSYCRRCVDQRMREPAPIDGNDRRRGRTPRRGKREV